MNGTPPDLDYVVTPSKVGLAEGVALLSYGPGYRRRGSIRGELDRYGQREETTVVVRDGFPSIRVPSRPQHILSGAASRLCNDCQANGSGHHAELRLSAR
jgi:hypothetical protein